MRVLGPVCPACYQFSTTLPCNSLPAASQPTPCLHTFALTYSPLSPLAVSPSSSHFPPPTGVLLQQDKFDALLPLYLTADHFNRALPHMAHLLPLLAPELVGRGGSPPPAAAWLEVLPKILNTQVCVSLRQSLCSHCFGNLGGRLQL